MADLPVLTDPINVVTAGGGRRPAPGPVPRGDAPYVALPYKALPCHGLPFANCDTRPGHTVVDHTSLPATGLHFTGSYGDRSTTRSCCRGNANQQYITIHYTTLQYPGKGQGARGPGGHSNTAIQ